MVKEGEQISPIKEKAALVHALWDASSQFRIRAEGFRGRQGKSSVLGYI